MAFMAPMTLATFATGASVAGTALGMTSAYMEGKAKSNMYNYQAGVAQMNKAIELQNAEWARYAGDRSARLHGQRVAQSIGQQIVRQAAGNIDVNRGSAARVTDSMRQAGYDDQLTIRENYARRAYGHEVQAANKEAEARNYKVAAKNARTAGYLNMASSFVTGASSVSSKWLEGQRRGIWGDSAVGGPVDLGYAYSDDPWYGLRESDF